MIINKGEYFRNLKYLDYSSINAIKEFLQNERKLIVSPLDKLSIKLTAELTRLPLYKVQGPKSWEGLLVCFPGTSNEITSRIVSTPYIRHILYPILELHHNIQLPCIYIAGERFPDVFLRKFKLLDNIIPHLIMLTRDLIDVKNKKIIKSINHSFNERSVQNILIGKMISPEGLQLPFELGGGSIRFIAEELFTGEGSTKPERLDILGYDTDDHSLIAFEIKGPDCSSLELKNLFLQGLDHRNWVEFNKMAIKLIFDGPYGKKINTRKRVRLLLGFFGESVPHLFYDLRKEAIKKDIHLKIEFVQFIKNKDGEIELRAFRK